MPGDARFRIGLILALLGTLPAASLAAESTVAETRPAAREAALDFASLGAPGALLTDALIQFRLARAATEVTVSLSQGHIALHYVPEPPEGVEKTNDVAADRFGLEANGRFRIGEPLTLLVGGGASTGYRDYRALWLDEHYRQLFGPVDGYRKAHPRDCSVSAGLRWEYLPAAGFLQGELIYRQEIVAPGYRKELFGPLVRLRDRYDAVGGHLSLENVLTRRLRSLLELRVTGTTARDPRYALQGSLNCALGESWVLRLQLAGTKEAPRFESWSAGATLERDWHETWFLGLTGRYYHDTGEADPAVAGDTSAPALESVQAGVGVRWKGRRSSFKLVSGPVFGSYAAAGPDAAGFSRLYRDRTWFSLECAFVHEM